MYLSSAPPARIDATLSARGTLPADAGGPVAQVRFALGEASRLDKRPLKGRGRLEVVGQRIADADVDLDLAGNNLVLRGAFGRRDDVLDLRIDAPRLASLGFGFGGRVQADARVTGGLQAPSGRLHAEASRLTLPGGQRVGALRADAALSDRADGPLSATITAEDVRADPQAAPLLRRAQVELRGTLRTHALEATAQGTPAGDVKLAVRGGIVPVAAPAGRSGTATAAPAGNSAPAAELVGALADGRARWRGTIDRLEVDGPETVRLTAPATLAAQRDAVRLADARLATSRGRIDIAEFGWTPRGVTSRGRIDDASLPPKLLAAGSLRSTLRFAGQWDLRVGDTLAGTLHIERSAGDVVLRGGDAGGTPLESDLALGLSTLQLDLKAAGERLTASVRVQGDRVGILSGQGRVQLARDGQRWSVPRTAPVDASAELSVPSLEWVGPVVGAGLRTAGTVSARLRVSGTVGAPVIAGSLAGDRLRVRLIEQGVDLSDGRVRLTIDESVLTLREAVFTAPIRQRPSDDRLDITAASAARPGTVTAQGTLRIAGEGAGAGLIRVQADRLAALQSSERWLMLSGNAALTLEPKRLLLSGDLRADAGSVQLGDEDRPQLGSDVVVLRKSAKGQPAARGDAPATPVAIDLGIGLGDHFYVSGRGLDARLAGAVRVRGRVGGTLLATGTVRTVDGTYNAYNQTLAIDRGVINFQGPIENPGLNIRAVRRGLTVEPGVEITGTVQDPRVKLVSTPDVPDAEKLSWLVLGYPSSQLSGREQELLGSAALALLAGQRSGGAGSDLVKSLGVDVGMRRGPSAAPGSATLAQMAASSPGAATPSTVDRFVTVGRRLSDKAYVGIEQSLTGTLTIVQLTYQLSRRLSAVARTGAENALDLLYTFSFK